MLICLFSYFSAICSYILCAMKFSPSLLFTICFALAGLFAVLTAYELILWFRFKGEYEQAKGIVIKNKIDKNKKFYPIVRFKTLDNQKITFTAATLARSEKHNEGDTVLVYYDLLNAEDVHIAGEESKMLRIYSLLMLVCVLMGGYGVWQQKQVPKTTDT
jgi:hypothetical protein